MDKSELKNILVNLCNEHNCDSLDDLRSFYLHPSHFFEFTREVLRFDLLQEDPHRQVCDFIAGTAGDGSNRSSNIHEFPLTGGQDAIKDLRRLAVFIPRDIFKTTIAAISYPIWKWCQDPILKMLIASATAEKAVNILTEIKWHLQNNRILMELYGDMSRRLADKDGVWDKKSFLLYDPASGDYVPYQNTPSCTALGMDGNFTGKHLDIFIGDDLVIPTNVTSPDQLAKTVKFLQDIEPILKFGADKIISGTRYDFQDAYGHLIKQENYDVIYRSAFNPDDTLWFVGIGLQRKHLKLAYHERERLSRLYLKGKEKEVGPYNFACQYMMTPINPKDANFKAEWIAAAIVDKCPLRLDELKIKQAVDPAAGGQGGIQRKTLDYTGIGVVGKDCQENIWVLKAVERKIGPVELADELLADQKEWQSEAICVEEVGFQSYIEPIIEQRAKELQQRVWFDRVRQSTRHSKNHRIVSRLVPLFASGKIKVMRNQTELISELTRFDGSRLNNKDNLLDMLEMAVRKLDPAQAPKKELTDTDIEQIKADKRKKDEFWDGNNVSEESVFEDVFLGGCL